MDPIAWSVLYNMDAQSVQEVFNQALKNTEVYNKMAKQCCLTHLIASVATPAHQANLQYVSTVVKLIRDAITALMWRLQSHFCCVSQTLISAHSPKPNLKSSALLMIHLLQHCQILREHVRAVMSGCNQSPNKFKTAKN